MKNENCGRCKHFKDVDADGFGQCNLRQFKYRPHRDNDACEHYEILNGGWTEITPDNVDMIDDGCIIIVTDGTYYNKASEWHLSIGTMAKLGGYYYFVLPELKLED